MIQFNFDFDWLKNLSILSTCYKFLKKVFVYSEFYKIIKHNSSVLLIKKVPNKQNIKKIKFCTSY